MRLGFVLFIFPVLLFSCTSNRKEKQTGILHTMVELDSCLTESYNDHSIDIVKRVEMAEQLLLNKKLIENSSKGSYRKLLNNVVTSNHKNIIENDVPICDTILTFITPTTLSTLNFCISDQMEKEPVFFFHSKQIRHMNFALQKIVSRGGYSPICKDNYYLNPVPEDDFCCLLEKCFLLHLIFTMDFLK
ncbi:MAG: hypothetical protein KKA07_05110 [Bacteroidetes bacterium]|nr:hypothetical protein [Bacteroidota bacterium]